MKYIINVLVFAYLSCLSAQAQLVEVSHTSGFYPTEFYVSVSTVEELRYTLDGTTPTVASPLFPDSILVQVSYEQSLSEIPTNLPGPHTSVDWQTSQYLGVQGTVLRLGVVTDGVIDTVFNYTYIIDELPELDVMSIVTEATNLFDYDQGIYVPGRHYDENIDRWQPGNFFRRGSEWERECVVQYIKSNEVVINQGAGVRIHGGASRAMPMKSLRLYARKSYGKSKFNFPFFDDKELDRFDKLILRNGGQDFPFTLIKDMFGQSLCKNVNVDYQAGKPVIVYLNGEYWGLHNLRERYDADYFDIAYEEDDIDLIEIEMAIDVDEGDQEAYDDFVSFYEEADLSNDLQYEAILGLMDIENYIDHHIYKSFFAVFDWPGNNTKLWRPRKSDAKWKWLMTDLDDGFRNVEFNAFKHSIRENHDGWPNPAWSTLLFRKLMENKSFKTKYRSRLDALLSSELSSTTTIPKLRAFVGDIMNELPNHIARWGYPASISEWNVLIDDIEGFLTRRGAIIVDHFNLTLKNQEELDRALKLYPNPSFGIVKYELSHSLQGIEVYNSTGSRISSMKESSDSRLDLRNYPSGIYILKFITEDGKIISRKVVLK